MSDLNDSRLPPGIARRLLTRLVPSCRGGELIYDLDHEYAERAGSDGRLRAGLWYWIQVLRPSTRRLLEVAGCAVLIPAMRATRVDPAGVLRAE